jgi:hypothetical protein
MKKKGHRWAKCGRHKSGPKKGQFKSCRGRKHKR